MKNLKWDAIIFTIVLIILVVVSGYNFFHIQKLEKSERNLQSAVYTQKHPAAVVTPAVTATPSATIVPTAIPVRSSVQVVTPVK